MLIVTPFSIPTHCTVTQSSLPNTVCLFRLAAICCSALQVGAAPDAEIEWRVRNIVEEGEGSRARVREEEEERW